MLLVGLTHIVNTGQLLKVCPFLYFSNVKMVAINPVDCMQLFTDFFYELNCTTVAYKLFTSNCFVDN